MSDNNIAQQIETIRKSKGITKTFVARQCGRSVNWYWKVEHGQLRLRVDDISQIAKALDVDPSIFFISN